MNNIAVGTASGTDIEKHLAINCATQRERDNFIIDHATSFKLLYKTHRTEIYSESFTTIEAARAAANFTVKLLPKKGRVDSAPINVIAYLENSDGQQTFEALVEQIKLS